MTDHSAAVSKSDATGRHALVTRALHALLASAVAVQLCTSLIMHGPRRDSAGDWLFEIHEYSGLTALAVASVFWLHVVVRNGGTDAKALFPWFSAQRRSALMTDIKSHWIELKSRHVPPYADDSPLASAVHGLGLLLMLGMAVTGAVFFLGLYLGTQKTGIYPLVLSIHKNLATLVWAYLFGHAGLAVLHHYLKQSSLSEMWSFRRSS